MVKLINITPLNTKTKRPSGMYWIIRTSRTLTIEIIRDIKNASWRGEDFFMAAENKLFTGKITLGKQDPGYVFTNDVKFDVYEGSHPDFIKIGNLIGIWNNSRLE